MIDRVAAHRMMTRGRVISKAKKVIAENGLTILLPRFCILGGKWRNDQPVEASKETTGAQPNEET